MPPLQVGNINFKNYQLQFLVHAVGSFEERVFYDKKVDFILGEGSEVGLPEGVDRAVRRINKGEKCRVVLKGRFGYGSNPPAEYNLPPNAEIEFTLFLPEFEKVKEIKINRANLKFRSRVLGK